MIAMPQPHEETHNPEEKFEQYRALLFSIAYRMLGSAMEAEDLVQDTFLRYQSTPPEEIRSLKAFLTTIVTRLSLNQLNSARLQREEYIGPWLPEPIHTHHSGEFASPTEQVDVHESVSMAFLVLLESLSPPERAVFLLREVFDHSYEEIAEIVGKSESTCRKLFSRARTHIHEKRPRFTPNTTHHEQLLQRFMAVVNAGDLDGLLSMLVDDVTMWTDGGGRATAATRILHGREHVAAFVMGTPRLLPDNATIEIRQVNSEPAIIIRSDEQAILIIFIQLAGPSINGVRVISNPDKLRNL